uniref:EAL domain-containing protein n=1 Tax=Lotharella globosa TaxID=91324 RepID=A0A7S3Z949_9EUKA
MNRDMETLDPSSLVGSGRAACIPGGSMQSSSRSSKAFPLLFTSCKGGGCARPSPQTPPLEPLDEKSYMENATQFDSKRCEVFSSRAHPGLPGEVNFDRSKPHQFSARKPPALSATQVNHLRRMTSCPDESWYRWRMMPIWSLEGQNRIVFGAESLFRTASGDRKAPWMDLIQLTHPSNSQEYIAWKLGEIQNARVALQNYPKLRRVFINTQAIDLLDNKFYKTLSAVKCVHELVLELDEGFKAWPKDSSSLNELIRRIRNLREIGYRFALDDVGENPLVNEDFIESNIQYFDYVKFSFKQCAVAFSKSSPTSKTITSSRSTQEKPQIDETTQRRHDECKRIRSTWARCTKGNKKVKFVLEFSVTKAMTQDLGDLFLSGIWGSSEWLIQGGITSEKAYPPWVFGDGSMGRDGNSRFCDMSVSRLCGWDKRNSFERAA